tara:strand:- start:1419 stop:1655 length:237 start_codon:yes stop_codon:yes gene_type:complete
VADAGVADAGIATAAYCQSLTIDGDGCVCITRGAAEKLVVEKKVDQQTMLPETSLMTSIMLMAGFLMGILYCNFKKLF